MNDTSKSNNSADILKYGRNPPPTNSRPKAPPTPPKKPTQ